MSREAAEHHKAGKHETAAHHTHLAHGHRQHAIHHAAEAAKTHIEDQSEGFQAIEVPSTRIVAREEFAKALARIAAIQGANILTRAEVRRLEPLRGGMYLVSEAGEIEGGGDRTRPQNYEFRE
jgi:L-2-hydroxyglutarate oxidase LhgO